MNKKILSTLMLLLLLGAVGCADIPPIKMDLYIKINEDKSGEYEVTVLTEPNAVSVTEFLQEELKKEGFTIQPLTRGNQSGWSAKMKMKDIQKDLQKSFPQIGASTTASNKSSEAYKQEKGLFWNKVDVNYDIDLSQIDQETPFEGLAELFYEKVDFDLHVTLPVEVEKHNATQVSEDGKTLTWPMKLGKHNPVVLSIEYPNPLGWTIAAIVLVAVIVAVVIFVWKRKRL